MPFRESKLTRLLQPALGGNARVAIVCNLSPAATAVDNTRATLHFAAAAKRVKLQPKVNEVRAERGRTAEEREGKRSRGEEGGATANPEGRDLLTLPLLTAGQLEWAVGWLPQPLSQPPADVFLLPSLMRSLWMTRP